METDIMRKTLAFVKSAVLSLVLFCTASTIASTPIQQALELEEDIKNVMVALKEVNQPADNLKQAPDKIRGLTRIGDLLDGVYDGPITISVKTFPYTAEYLLEEVTGRFDIYAPNLTSLPANAFREAVAVDTFYAPELTSIGANAFDMGSIDTYKVPGIRNLIVPKCTSFGIEAFEGCHYLTNVICNATSLGNNYLFNACVNLENLESQPLTSIGYYTLSNCQKLKYLNLSPTSVSFGEYACNNCYVLNITNWPASVSVSKYCFANCRAITNVNELIGRWTTAATEGVFQNCKGLTELKSENITSITTSYLFDECSGVTNIWFPNLITLAGNDKNCSQMFDSMTSLKTVYMPKLATIGIGSGSDSFDYGMASWTAVEELEFPSLTQIGDAYGRYVDYIWRNNYNMKRISCPQLHTMYCGGGAFAWCTHLKHIELPALKILSHGWRRGGEWDENGRRATTMFYRCDQLEEINLPNLETILAAELIFTQCYSLKKVNAPKLVNIMYEGPTSAKDMQYIFAYCPSLREVTFGLKASELLAYKNFGSWGYYSAPYANVTFHCPADAPFNVDVMYVNGAWTAVTNGTFRLADYIQGSGIQHISTGYIHKTNTVVEIDFALVPQVSPKQYEFIFGTRKDSDTVNSFAMLSMWNNAKKFDYMRNSNVQSGVYSLDEETRFKAICSLQNCDIYNAAGEQIYSMVATGTPNEGVGPLAVFTANNSTTTGAFSPNTYAVQNMKLYRFTIKEEGETVMDLVPGVVGYGESEAPCLLDACDNWHPLFNAGSGQFTYGSVTNNVPTPGT